MDKPNETPETIYLIPDSEHGHVWCDDPAPGLGMDPEDAVEYRRANAISPVCYLCSQTITGNKDAALEAAKARIAELEGKADTGMLHWTERLACRVRRAAGEHDDTGLAVQEVVAKMNSRIDALEKALEPFGISDDVITKCVDAYGLVCWQFDADDLRRAAALLKEKE